MKNLGTALIDIGGGTTDVIVYYNNSILHTGAVPLGGTNITNDIAHVIRCPLDKAESIKCEHGIAKESLALDEKNISIIGKNGRNDFRNIKRYC